MERLRLLASAIAGRSVEVVAADPSEQAWTDGVAIHVPSDAGHRDAVRMVSVQAALVAAGSLTPLLGGARRPRVAPRYLAVEGHRALGACEDLLPAAARSLIDHRVASAVRSADESMALACSRSAIAPAPWEFGALHPRRVLEPAAPTSASQTLVELEEDDADEDARWSWSSPVGGGGPLGKLLARLLSPTRSRVDSGPLGADRPTHASSVRPGAGRPVTTALRPDAATGVLGDADNVGTSYPEWDVHGARYRADWCTVTERNAPLVAAAQSTALDGATLRRPLARLGVGLAPTRRQPGGDDIDIDAAVELVVDTRLGRPHGEDVYVASLRRRRDLAVLVLLDVSGSAGEPGTGGRAVHEHQRAAAAVLTSAAHELGDRVALYAFNSRGRKAVQLLRVKAFDDHLDAHVARRLDGLVPGAYTRLGAAIRHGTTILEHRAGTPRRLLVVLSDGFAYDHGYEGRYGEADARRALLEARRAGVGCLCLSVGADVEPAALRRVFGSAAHASVPRADQLPAVIGPLFRAAIRSAEAQQRVHHRRERAKERLDMDRRNR
ncbi:MAG: VWA domain-containing protein [Actinobacteria bacterium]|nr:VWA domain-containing protein [Actinomycetota bacterium]